MNNYKKTEENPSFLIISYDCPMISYDFLCQRLPNKGSDEAHGLHGTRGSLSHNVKPILFDKESKDGT